MFKCSPTKGEGKRQLKIRDFWNVAQCSLVGVGRRFRGAYCLHHQGDDGIFNGPVNSSG
jgi:hypothetical protein